MQIDHSKSQPMDDKLHVIHFKFQGPEYTSGITKARIVKCFTQVGYI